MKRKLTTILTLAFTCGVYAIVAPAQSGGGYVITQSVIAGGGGTSNGDSYSVTGTISQSIAGTDSIGSAFRVRGGFWQSQFSPTAAMVTLSGRVSTAENQGISRARVTINSSDGTTRTALTGAFGYFRFDDVEVGQTYIVSIHSKRFQFANPTQVVSVNDEITDLDFTALPN